MAVATTASAVLKVLKSAVMMVIVPVVTAVVTTTATTAVTVVASVTASVAYLVAATSASLAVNVFYSRRIFAPSPTSTSTSEQNYQLESVIVADDPQCPPPSPSH